MGESLESIESSLAEDVKGDSAVTNFLRNLQQKYAKEGVGGALATMTDWAVGREKLIPLQQKLHMRPFSASGLRRGQANAPGEEVLASQLAHMTLVLLNIFLTTGPAVVLLQVPGWRKVCLAPDTGAAGDRRASH